MERTTGTCIPPDMKKPRFTQTLTTASLVVLGAAFAFAQTSRTPPDPATLATMRVNRLASQLNLTDAQKTSAIGIFTTAYTSAQTIQTSLQANRTALSAAIKKNDTASIDQLSAASGTLNGQLTAINSKADAALYALLTADQKTLYDAMPGGGPGGRGGFGGPGGSGGGMRGRRGQ
jgi:Spy/CpxP family protein refolding chaperone